MYDNHPIVIIDDHNDYSALVAQGFKTAGCSKEIIQFDNGSIFLQFLNGIPRNEFPSMVMLNLDKADKAPVLEEIKSNVRFRQIPVLVYTQQASAETRNQAFSRGANCYFAIPPSERQIVEMLSSVALLWCLQ